MATNTSSLAQAGVQPKYNATGNQHLRVKIDNSANTLSDIILLAKVPNGALVTAVNGVFGTSNTDSVIKLGWRRHSDGTGGSETAFGTYTASSTTGQSQVSMNAKLVTSQHISFTDTLGSDFADIYATCSVGSFSDTWSLDLIISYHNDHREGQGS